MGDVVPFETEYVFKAEDMPTLNWSKVNSIVTFLKHSRILPPIDLEDEDGNINPNITPRQADQFADYIADNGVAVADYVGSTHSAEGHERPARDMTETGLFVVRAMNWFRTCAHSDKNITVGELPVSRIDITA